MNRRNFVVGLGTVATISGVASVTAAQFAESVSPSADFRVRPENAQLTVDVTPNFNPGNSIWSANNLTDFNETEGAGSNVIAHLNNSTGTNDELVATLTFNNTNTSPDNSTNGDIYTAYAHPSDSQINAGESGAGFFEVNNNGETTESVGITFTYGGDVGTGAITEEHVAEAFQFFMRDASDGDAIKRISPNATDTANPLNYATINSGDSEIVGLEIQVHNNLYDAIQADAGGAFTETATNLQLISSVDVGIEQGA